MNELKKALPHFRITSARLELFEALRSADVPLPIADIHARCEKSDRASTYRNLELFIQAGIVTVIPIGWKKRYELASPFKPHHHHIQCTNCGKLVDIKTPELETLIETIAKSHKFTLSSHHIELAGLCSNCKIQR